MARLPCCELVLELVISDCGSLCRAPAEPTLERSDPTFRELPELSVGMRPGTGASATCSSSTSASSSSSSSPGLWNGLGCSRGCSCEFSSGCMSSREAASAAGASVVALELSEASMPLELLDAAADGGRLARSLAFSVSRRAFSLRKIATSFL